MYSLNPPGVTVTHAGLSAGYPDTPLCGFSGEDETVTRDSAAVDCLDCIAALGTGDPETAVAYGWPDHGRD